MRFIATSTSLLWQTVNLSVSLSVVSGRLFLKCLGWVCLGTIKICCCFLTQQKQKSGVSLLGNGVVCTWRCYPCSWSCTKALWMTADAQQAVPSCRNVLQTPSMKFDFSATAWQGWLILSLSSIIMLSFFSAQLFPNLFFSISRFCLSIAT